MAFYSRNNLFSTATIPLASGIPVQMDDKDTRKITFMNVKPGRTAYMKSPSTNAIAPITDSLVASRIDRDIIFENIKPVVTILRILGVMPITRPSPGVNLYHLASPAMLYSCIIFFTLIFYILYLSLYKVEILRSTEGKFEEAVIEYLFTVYMLPIFSIPILCYETMKIVDVFNNWVDFEIAYKQMMGRVLPLNLHKKSLVIAIAVPVLSMTSVLVTHITMVHFRIMQIIPYAFLEIMTYVLGAYWYLLCEALSLSANVLAEDFHKALRLIGPAGKVAEYRYLWLRLSKLARDIGMSHCYTFTFMCLYLFLIITLSIYGLLSQISEGFGLKDIGLAVTASYSIVLLFFICDEAHYASYNVCTNFQKKLLMAELTWMNIDAQTEVNMFLRATEMNPAQINLGGFFNVNRNLFKSMLATMVTYLVVLLQFQISIPSDKSITNIEVPENITVTATETITSTMTTILTTLVKKKRKH